MALDSLLACSVRGCGEALVRVGHAWSCPRRHSFDVARSGYLNLLQPQDRRSSSAGDARAAIEARARLLARGVGMALLDEVRRWCAALGLARGAVALELGSGTGELLGALHAELGLEACGIDLAASAAEHAARRFPGVTWLVANADRRLPVRDRAVDLVLSVHGRRNPSECARVLRPSGRFLLAVPAADDLIELRAVAQGRGLERERVPALLSELAPDFEVLEHRTFREQRRLAHPELVDLLHSTYRSGRGRGRVAALEELSVTLASELVLCAPRSA